MPYEVTKVCSRNFHLKYLGKKSSKKFSRFHGDFSSISNAFEGRGPGSPDFWHCDVMLSSTNVQSFIHSYCWIMWSTAYSVYMQDRCCLQGRNILQVDRTSFVHLGLPSGWQGFWVDGFSNTSSKKPYICACV